MTGYWIFKGTQNRAQGNNAYGTSWHCRDEYHDFITLGMPTSVIRTHYQQQQHAANKRMMMGNDNESAVSFSTFSSSSSPSLLSSFSKYSEEMTRRGNINKKQHAVVSTSDSPCIVRIHTVKQVDSKGHELHPNSERNAFYQFFDERYLSLITEKICWPRDRGIVELIPIVVGIGVV